MTFPTDKEMALAIGRIACTSDGLLLRRYLQLVLNEVPNLVGESTGPLLLSTGRRHLARDLIAAMDTELSKGATLERSNDPGAPVIREPAKPIASRDVLRRRVEPYADD